MSSEPLPPELKSKNNQKPLVPDNPQRAWNQTTYKDEYCDIVYKLLSTSADAKNLSDVCSALKCSRNTLIKWRQKHPEFNSAVVNGLEIGKGKWLRKIAEHAYEPTSTVNNGLIKLLSSHIYGIKEDEPAVVINNNINTDPEELLKEKGIPVPDLGIDDSDDR